MENVNVSRYTHDHLTEDSDVVSESQVDAAIRTGHLERGKLRMQFAAVPDLDGDGGEGVPGSDHVKDGLEGGVAVQAECDVLERGREFAVYHGGDPGTFDFEFFESGAFLDCEGVVVGAADGEGEGFEGGSVGVEEDVEEVRGGFTFEIENAEGAR